jgi:hypothetical protein
MEHAELADRFGYATDWDALPLATLRRVATVLDKEKRR